MHLFPFILLLPYSGVSLEPPSKQIIAHESLS